MKPGTVHGPDSALPGADKSGFIAVLDGWRGLAISLVLCYHALVHCDLPQRGFLPHARKIMDHLGPFGVLIFFMISGYLITGRMLVEHAKIGRFALGEFYYKRAFRILPLAFAYLVLIAIAGGFHLIELKIDDLAALCFASNYVQDRSWYTGHFWSLSIEEHFYLLWPPIIALLKWRKAFWVGVFLVIVEAIWRPWELHHTASQYAALQRTDMRLDYLMLGSIFAMAAYRWPSFKKLLVRSGTLPATIFIVCILGVVTLPWSVDLRSLQALALAFLVCGTALSQSRVVNRLLANRPLLFIGKISYSIYILQQPFFVDSSHKFFNTPLAELLKLPIIIGLSYLSYTWFERFFISYSRSHLARRNTVASHDGVAVI
jgi:peptidoglycan/LPS O-acetylase OafA/YrhL